MIQNLRQFMMKANPQICNISLNHHIKNGWLKYDHRVMNKKYTTPLPPMGCGVVERHLEMAQSTKKF